MTTTEPAVHAGECSCQTDNTTTATSGASVSVSAAGPMIPGALPGEWHAYLTVEGLRTSDHRMIAAGALTWRDLPIPLWAQFDNSGHDGAATVGSIRTIERQGDRIYAEGTFDLEGTDGVEAARMCAAELLRWVSVDLEVLSAEYVELDEDGNEIVYEDLLDLLFGPMPADWYDLVTEGRIGGATMVGFPAFPQAVITPLAIELPEVEPMTTDNGILVAAATITLETPPASWFTDPALTEATPTTVTDDGRVYGHLALWGTCHTGIPGACVVPPRTSHDYSYFRTGTVETTDGFVKVGHLTVGTGHAPLGLKAAPASMHYDDTGAAVADVAVGEDEFGIWFAGALRPDVTAQQVRVLRASAISGDWRKIGGHLELVAALCVNVPGFPIVASGAPVETLRPRFGMDAGEQLSLVAAGVVRHRNPLTELRSEVARLRSAVEPLMPLAVDALRRRVAG